ncbi:MAG: hypothetical protein ABW123_17455 [Cystobacter sp.]
MRALSLVLLLSLSGGTACGAEDETVPGESLPLATQTAAAGASCFSACNGNYISCLERSTSPLGQFVCGINRHDCFDSCGLQDDLPPIPQTRYYGVGSGAGDNSSDVFTFVHGSGVASSFQKLGESGRLLTDIAAHPGTGTLYASDVFGGLYSLDASTGAATLVMHTPGVNALDFCGGYNSLYAWGGSTLYLIDIGSLTWSTVGDVGFNSSGDLACSLWGTLYGLGEESSNTALIRINRRTGAGTWMGSLNWPDVYGMEIDQSDRPIGAVSYGTAILLLGIHPTTGAASIVNSIQTTSGMNGLTTHNVAY